MPLAIVCPNCRGEVRLRSAPVRRAYGNLARGGVEVTTLEYEALDAHVVENVQIFGKLEPDVIVSRCPSLQRRNV